MGGALYASLQELMQELHLHTLLHTPGGWVTFHTSLACVAIGVGKQSAADVMLPFRGCAVLRRRHVVDGRAKLVATCANPFYQVYTELPSSQ